MQRLRITRRRKKKINYYVKLYTLSGRLIFGIETTIIQKSIKRNILTSVRLFILASFIRGLFLRKIHFGRREKLANELIHTIFDVAKMCKNNIIWCCCFFIYFSRKYPKFIRFFLLFLIWNGNKVACGLSFWRNISI